MKRRTVLMLAPAAALAPNIAFAEPEYTVEQHIWEMAEAGAHYTRANSGLTQGLRSVDWELYQAAKKRADGAKIDATDIFNALDYEH